MWYSDPTSTTFYGHATFTPLSSNGSLPTNDEVDTLCLAADYAYEGSTPYISPCSESDDSGQFLFVSPSPLFRASLPPLLSSFDEVGP